MRRLIAIVAALLAVIAQPSRAEPAVATITADVVRSSDGRLHELTIASPALDRAAKVRVLLPAGYRSPATAATRYPVLYLMHGVGDTSASWSDRSNVEEQTAPLDLLVVMPDAGRSPDVGWYSNWVDGPQWESFHIGELVPLVDATYRTLGTREGRAIVGQSMGGFGAMSYASRHPDLFTFAAGFSGFVDTTQFSVAQGLGFDLTHPQFGTPTERVWGPYVGDEVRWHGHNPVDLASNLRSTELRLRSGNGVPAAGDRPESGFVEAFVYLSNVSFHGALDRSGVSHSWFDRGFGTHEWTYWQADLAATLPAMMERFTSARPSAAFDYRSIEPTFDIYGWTFEPHRDVMEFIDLTAVSPRGLTARGSGTVSVVTPPSYEPGATYAVAGQRTVAEDDGRVRFTIDLGPAHEFEQFSPQAIAAELAAGPAYWRTTTASIELISRPNRASGRATATNTSTGTLPATGGAAPAGVATGLVAAALVIRAAAGRGRGRAGPRRT